MALKFSINEIAKELERGKGISKASHYAVFIQPPKSMQGGLLETIGGTLGFIKNGEEILGLSTKCQSTTLPGKKIATQNFLMYGTQQQMPYGINYSPWSAQFICTNSMEERNFFDNWMKSITDPFSNNFNYYKDYVSNIWLIKLPEGEPKFSSKSIIELSLSLLSGSSLYEEIAEQFGVYLIKLEDAYPVEITSQEMSYDSEAYLTVNVDFVYRKFHSIAEFAKF